jgi:hypothetical protein
MAPDVLERELPADPFRLLPNREELARAYLDEVFVLGMEWYPRIGPSPEDRRMPNTASTVLVALHKWNNGMFASLLSWPCPWTTENKDKTPIEAFSQDFRLSGPLVLEMAAAIRVLERAGIDVAAIKSYR